MARGQPGRPQKEPQALRLPILRRKKKTVLSDPPASLKRTLLTICLLRTVNKGFLASQ